MLLTSMVFLSSLIAIGCASGTRTQAPQGLDDPSDRSSTQTSAKAFSAEAQRFSRECEESIVESCVGLARLYEKGQGVTEDESRAVAFYAKACELEDAMSCYTVAFLCEAGLGVEQDDNKATAFYRKACTGGLREGCSKVEIAELDNRCQRGSSSDCMTLGLSLLKLDVPDHDRAITIFDRACTAGEMAACGHMLSLIAAVRPRQVEFRRDKSELMERCERDEPADCTTLGYRQLIQTPADYRTASTLFKRACEGGDQDGCLYNADLKRARASEFRELSCKSGDSGACGELGIVLARRGKGDDPVRAATLLQAACVPARPSRECGTLGALYLLGRGVARDRRKGLELIKRACNGADDAFCHWLPDPEAEAKLKTLLARAKRALRRGVKGHQCRTYASGPLDRGPPNDMTRGDLFQAANVMDEHPALAARFERDHAELVAQRDSLTEKVRNTCFEREVVGARKGTCAKAAGLILKGLGLKAKVKTTGPHREVLSLSGVPCDGEALKLHHENLEYTLRSCRFGRLECGGSSLDLGWDTVERDEFGDVHNLKTEHAAQPTRRPETGKALYLPPLEFCQQLSEVYCEAHGRCCPAPEATGPDCVEKVRSSCTGRYQYSNLEELVHRGAFDRAAGWAAWDGEAAARSIKAFAASAKTCSAEARPPSFHIATTGLVQEGDDCDYARSASCAKGLRCISRLVCMTPAHEGQECIEEGHCARGLYCDDTNEDQFVCRRLKRAGEACRYNLMCTVGLQCSAPPPVEGGEGVCLRPRAGGTKCTVDPECASNDCRAETKTCEPPRTAQEQLYCDEIWW